VCTAVRVRTCFGKFLPGPKKSWKIRFCDFVYGKAMEIYVPVVNKIKCMKLFHQYLAPRHPRPGYRQCRTLHLANCKNSLLWLSLFGNLDLWAVESFGKVMEILTGQGVRTLCCVYKRILYVMYISDLFRSLKWCNTLCHRLLSCLVLLLEQFQKEIPINSM
jgi:hypothetical protein